MFCERRILLQACCKLGQRAAGQLAIRQQVRPHHKKGRIACMHVSQLLQLLRQARQFAAGSNLLQLACGFTHPR